MVLPPPRSFSPGRCMFLPLFKPRIPVLAFGLWSVQPACACCRRYAQRRAGLVPWLAGRPGEGLDSLVGPGRLPSGCVHRHGAWKMEPGGVWGGRPFGQSTAHVQRPWTWSFPALYKARMARTQWRRKRASLVSLAGESGWARATLKI